MKCVVFSLLLVFVGGAIAQASQKSVICHMKGIQDPLSFGVSGKMGDFPKVDFAYPVNVTRFSMREGNLLLVAMDQEERDRPRIFISAQFNQHNQTYIGQFMTDLGGNQLQLDNGSVSCILK
ncbi:Uncharacterised protein [Legionella sainthelensi]|uniref:Uncharacterized protein n=1 Tax=Legionella sainthelensi TaxID=28087 RepID=A0A2H5FHK7_9GAMM|nr:hypothetical protein [Legionella sainthelensi]AUH70993.1 hypothetical protein CAB17_02175 [Legionella sainthelensi]VEB38759.1 Uncharacterised protein [Legionella sainthelensi]